MTEKANALVVIVDSQMADFRNGGAITQHVREQTLANLKQAIMEYRNVLVYDLNTKYDGSENYMPEDDVFLTDNIQACNDFMIDHLAIDADGSEL